MPDRPDKRRLTPDEEAVVARCADVLAIDLLVRSGHAPEAARELLDRADEREVELANNLHRVKRRVWALALAIIAAAPDRATRVAAVEESARRWPGCADLVRSVLPLVDAIADRQLSFTEFIETDLDAERGVAGLLAGNEK